MSKVTYSSLKLKLNDSIKTIEKFPGVEVKQYLPTEDKIDLIDITLQKAKEDGIYNPIKANMFFHLYLVYLYTNISFTDKQREDEYKLYDILVTNGVIDEVIAAMPESEYTDLLNKVIERIDIDLKYNTTAASVISKLINDLPRNAEAAQNIVDNFDPEKYKAVLDFAKAANGDRDI